MYKGKEQILYLTIDNVDIPIGCLTDNSFNESSEMLDTTTTDNAGWKTSIPTNQEYIIDFNGVLVLSDVEPLERISYDILKSYKRNRTLLQWKKEINGVFTETGQAYIVELGEASSVNEFITFNCTMEGYGSPVDVNLYTFEDNNQVILNDG